MVSLCVDRHEKEVKDEDAEIDRSRPGLVEEAAVGDTEGDGESDRGAMSC